MCGTFRSVRSSTSTSRREERLQGWRPPNSDTGAGYAWIDGPGFDIRGSLVGGESYNAEALLEAVSFQASVTRWLALRLGGGGGLDGGSHARSALAGGMVSPILASAGATASWQLAGWCGSAAPSTSSTPTRN